ncbi:hypothetical protein [Nitratireductor basaltis]|uniref:Uncharacterized protein n=1 Tax=Nitratireductor basaltis TaxID=472175 RepID=A0A084U7K2_9HYPH|nr:hypothetical protein [Nitratireductor basaltis]KFB08938.1 hypothetical protein EL18_03194 [Nitratireductor basaltis]
MTADRKTRGDHALDLPVAPLAMPEQVLVRQRRRSIFSHPRLAWLAWR